MAVRKLANSWQYDFTIPGYGRRRRAGFRTRAEAREAEVDAIRWHIRQGYSGEEFLFSDDGAFPVHLDSHKRPLRTVQRALGLREVAPPHVNLRSTSGGPQNS